MAVDAVQPTCEPDPGQMLRHLEHLFGGDLDGCQDGLVELAWTDGADGRLRHALLFGTDRLDGAVEEAVRRNRVAGQNLYVGAALRRPGTPPFGRAADADVLALPACYVDVDDGDAAQRLRERYRGCPPTAAVVTGRQPHVRVQLWWRQEAPARDLELCRRQNVALAAALGGDPSVVNPSRVMRLAGSIAWPRKPGRVVELTELQLFQDGRPAIYYPGQLARAFPPAEPAAVGQTAAPAPADAAPATASLAIGSTDGVTVEACLDAIRAGSQWHNNLVRLVGHWIARGWSDAEIVTAAEALTLPGYTVQQTRAETARMIAGGRRKWNRPNPSIEIDVQERPAFVLHPIGLLDPARRPPRDWLVRHRLMRRHTSVTAAAPGVGKSTLAIEEAVSLASGRDFLGFGIDRPHKVAVINNEETRDELERRIEATCVRFEVPFEAIAATLHVHSGVDAGKFTVARRGPDDSVVVQAEAPRLAELLADAGIDLLVIDPFVQLHTVSENVNGEIEQVMVALRDIAASANCALHLVHHTRKPPAGSAHQAGDIFAVRGGGAIVGDAHFVFTLADMATADAEALGIAEAERRKFVRLDDAKGKLAPPGGALWFERVGVPMPYGLIGEEVGVLVPHAFERERSGTEVPAAGVRQILAEIDRRWRDGNPYSVAPQSVRYAVPMMVGQHAMSAKAARHLLAQWIANGTVASETYDSVAKARGLKVLAWPG